MLAEFGVKMPQNQTGTFQLNPFQLAKSLAETQQFKRKYFLISGWNFWPERGKRLISGLTCHKGKGSWSLTQASAGSCQVWVTRAVEKTWCLYLRKLLCINHWWSNCNVTWGSLRTSRHVKFMGFHPNPLKYRKVNSSHFKSWSCCWSTDKASEICLPQSQVTSTVLREGVSAEDKGFVVSLLVNKFDFLF